MSKILIFHNIKKHPIVVCCYNRPYPVWNTYSHGSVYSFSFKIILNFTKDLRPTWLLGALPRILLTLLNHANEYMSTWNIYIVHA